MQGKEIPKKQNSAQLSPEQVSKQGRLYEEGIKAGWYQNLLEYTDQKISELSSRLIFTDHQSLEEIRFIQGQIAGIFDIKARPEKIIAMRKQIIEEREERAKKKKEKEQRGGRR